MFRFFADKKDGESFLLSNETLKHMKIARVLNEEFVIIHDSNFYKCKLKGERAIIINEIDENHEHAGEVIIAASFINTKRFEWLIQKATELGATKLIPVISQNVSNKISGELIKKIERWNQIALNSSQQSFRNKPMIVEKPLKFKDAIKIEMEHKFIAYVKKTLDVEITFPVNSIFFIGPEGGYTQEEIDSAISNNVKVISLGSRILRAETASIFVLSRVN